MTMVVFGALSTVVGCQFIRLRNKRLSERFDKEDDATTTTATKNNNDEHPTTNPGSNDDHAKTALRLIQKRRSIFPKQYSTSQQQVPDSVIDDMLEAARWAPTHKLTQPWRFVVFRSKDAKESLAVFLANHYQAHTSPAKYNEAKYQKKKANVLRSSHVVAICVALQSGQSSSSSSVPHVEEVCSVAMAVQNMHLVATANHVGAYWSSSAVYDKRDTKESDGSSSSSSLGSSLAVVNPPELRDFLNLSKLEKEESSEHDNISRCLCLGWLFVGNLDDAQRQKWPESRRANMDQKKVLWR